MNRQLYDLGGAVDQARDFYTNNLGMNPQEANAVLSDAMASLNQQTQPQSMMQMASNGGRIGFSEGGLTEYELLKLKELGYNVRKEGTETFGGVSVLKDILKTNKMAGGGIARLGYQMGGITSMPMNFGQPLQVPQQTSMPMQPMMSSPMANYGQTPLTMAGGGIARLGYQMGGEAMMQPQMGGEMAMPQMNEQQALETIIQLLIEQGIDPETALQLAAQILQIFAQGGEPAVEAFANQLEQQEQVQEMAGGGIAGLYPRQGYFVGKIVRGVTKAVSGVVKGVAKAVKSVAKSPIGRAALTIGAATFLGPGAFGIQGLGLSGLQLGLATAASNLGLQAIGGQKLNFLEAGLSGLSAGLQNPGLSGDPSTIAQGGLTDAQLQAAGQTSNFGSTVNVPLNQIQPVDIPFDTGSYAGSVQKFTDVGMITPSPQDVLSNVKASNLASSQGQTLQQLGELTPKPTGFFESMPGKVQSGIQSLYKDPMGTISDLAKSGYESVKENIVPLTVGAGVGAIAFGAPQQPEESNEDFARRQEEEANLSLTQFGRNLQIKNPFFYARYGAVNPFAEQAAQGGIMGYAAGGSMIPPARRIEGGVIELDARKTGGYIPYGKKERVDDVPAMLAKDEFVFTSRAVKGAGDGSARRGAAKMYKLMKQLEAKGKKMERQGARA